MQAKPTRHRIQLEPPFFKAKKKEKMSIGFLGLSEC